MSDSEADENTCLMSSESTSQLCPSDNPPPMERDLVSVFETTFLVEGTNYFRFDLVYVTLLYIILIHHFCEQIAVFDTR